MDWSNISQYLEGRSPDLMNGTGRFAVLVPVVEVAGEPHLLYEVRAKHMRLQPGEICFPGGRIEGDETAIQTALRETQEELSVAPEQIKVLGQLDFVVHRANFILYPVLAKLELGGLQQISPNPEEVDEFFLVPLSHLQSAPQERYRCKLIPQPEEAFSYDKLGLDAPYNWRPGQEEIIIYRWKKHIIWGLTAKITRHFLEIFNQENLI